MTQLARRLGPVDAVVVGLGAMLGAGVFVVWAPATAAAGTGLLAALAVAGLVAACNATSSARLAAVHPTAGGAYAYGRTRLGPTWGFAAGWCFVVGKTASCAAMALTAGQYAAAGSPGLAKAGAVTVVVVCTAVNALGVHRTAQATRVLVGVTVAVLVLVVASAADAVEPARLTGSSAGPGGVLEAAGLLFFAFAGYARLTTLGEEVSDPRRTIPRAVALSLGLVLVGYAVVGAVLLGVLGADGLALSAAPLRDVVPSGLRPVVTAGAVVASVSVLLSLLAGVARTGFAMGRDGELPRRLGAVDPRTGGPVVAQLAVGGSVVGLVLVADLASAVAVSGVGVLLYYAVAGASAWTLGGRLRVVAAAGVLGCLLLAASLPPAAALPTAVVLVVGLVVRALVGR